MSCKNLHPMLFVLPMYVTTRPSFESNWDHKLSPFFVMQIQGTVMINYMTGNLHDK